MKRILFALVSAVSLLIFSGCASNLMRDAPSQEIAPAGQDRAQVVFMRSSIVLAAVGCDMFEVVDGELRYIGQLPTGAKLVFETTPGEKVFMAWGTAADFMLARLEGGKTYYSIVRPNWGTGGFAPTPIRGRSAQQPDLGSAQFQQWFSETKRIEPTGKAQEWFVKNKDRLQAIYAEYWERFQSKSPAEKAERTLMPADGQ